MGNKLKIVGLTVIGMSLNFIVFILLSNYQEKNIQQDYYLETEHVVDTLKREVTANFEILRQLQLVYSEFGDMTPESFANMTSHALNTHSTIQALEWIPSIQNSERTQYEDKQKNIYPNFQIKQRNKKGELERATIKERYFPVGLVEPVEGNKAAIGFDLSSSSTRMTTLKKSATTNQMLATAGINLVQVKSDDKGFLVFVPVYNKNESEYSLDNVIGFILGVYQSTDMLFESLSETAKRHSSFKVFDKTNATSPILMTSYEPDNFVASDLNITYPPISIAGRTWAIESTPSSQHLQKKRSITPLASLIIGLIVLYIFITSYYKTLTYATSVETQVKERTQELERSRHFIESLTNAVPVLLAYVNSEEKYQYVNQKYLSMFDKDLSDFNDATIKQIVGNKQYETLKPKLDSAFNGKATELIEEFIIKDKQFWLRISLTPRVYDTDNVQGIFISIEDITQQINDRDKMEEYAQKIEFDSWALEEAKDIAEEATKLKSMFLANMSHEIRTPLSGVMGLLNLISETKLNTEQKEYIELAHSSAESLLTIINDILDLSKVEAGKLEVETRAFNIYNKMEGVYQTYNLLTQEKGLKFEFETNLPQNKFILGDEVRVLQIVNNLMSNALKFTRKGSIKLTTHLKELDNLNALLEIKVSDTGMGITPKQLEKLFDAFEQADSSTSREFGGTGLGLTISQKLAKLMDGKIEAESEFGVGTVFTCTIKTKIEPNEKNNQVESNSESAVLYQGLKCLIVEDNPVNQMIAKKMLSSLGLSTDIAENGQQAIDKLKTADTKFDLVFMDCMMPIMDGYEASRKIKANDKLSATPIVAMTANAMQGDRNKCIDAGMDEYLTKPLNISELKLVLLKIFNNIRYH